MRTTIRETETLLVSDIKEKVNFLMKTWTMLHLWLIMHMSRKFVEKHWTFRFQQVNNWYRRLFLKIISWLFSFLLSAFKTISNELVELWVFFPPNFQNMINWLFTSSHSAFLRLVNQCLCISHDLHIQLQFFFLALSTNFLCTKMQVYELKVSLLLHLAVVKCLRLNI